VVADFVTYTQRRWTGGIRLIEGQLQVHIDPGPGAVVRSVDAGLSIERVRLLLLSHSHPDHCGDAEIFVEGMTRGTTRRRGILVAPRSVLSGHETVEASISRYHQSLVSELIQAQPGGDYHVEGIRVHATKAMHTDPDCVGYVIDCPGSGRIGYVSDTGTFDGLVDQYRGTRLLILCVMRPRGAPLRGHLSVDDARDLIASARPDMAVMTHFGMRMLNESPVDQAKYIQESTGIRTAAGFDGMVLGLNRNIEVTSLRRHRRVATEGKAGHEKQTNLR
jgi:phosphoribosyl 1,2-cyclic phosphodiesterase